MTRLKSDPSSDHTFADKYGPWALVTGAAQGIGSAYAEALAQRRLNLVLLDKQEEPLRKVAQALQERYGVQTKPVVADLAHADFIDIVREQTADLAVGLLICNAAVGQVGPFLDESIESLQLAIGVNCSAPTILTHVFGKQMVERRKGGIILMASGVAYHGFPFMASYAATKSYNLILGESLWYEFRQHGVDVLAYIPGDTNTPALRKVLPQLKEGMAGGGIKLPSETAEAALQALGKVPSVGRDRRINWLIFKTRFFSRRRVIELNGDLASKRRPTRGG